jgi:hypothetical protein
MAGVICAIVGPRKGFEIKGELLLPILNLEAIKQLLSTKPTMSMLFTINVPFFGRRR